MSYQKKRLEELDTEIASLKEEEAKMRSKWEEEKSLMMISTRKRRIRRGKI